MKTKTLQINHIAKRLPYGLKFIAEDKEWQMTSVNYLDPNYPIWANNYWDEEKLKFYPEINVKDNSIGRGFNINDIKPILFPLSSLTGTITINGESFVPIEIIKSFNLGHVDWLTKEREHWIWEFGLSEFIGKTPNKIIDFLIENHFDTEGLIEKGLAISVFDLTENPYA